MMMRLTKCIEKLRTASALLYLALSATLEPALSAPRSYTDHARIQVDALLEHGLDREGEVRSNLWASVMDIESLSVPEGGVKPTQGVREYDRALGGSNLYHELDTIKTLDLLAEMTGNKAYAKAANEYIADSFRLTQHPKTGLLGWGEHLYYNFYLDKVWAGAVEPETPRMYYYSEMPHELMEFTPPWDRLSVEHADGVRRAIDGLIYHFNGPDPQTYLFNRHAYWDKPERQTTIMPWIKHTALYAYSWAFLYRETGDAKYLKWSYDIGSLYHRLRDVDTGLVFGTLVHHNVGDGKVSSLNGSAYYAYWLYKTYQLSGDNRLREMGLSAIDSFLKYADEGRGKYYSSLNLDGSPSSEEAIATTWKAGYSAFTLPSLGRVLLYLAKHEPLTDFGVRSAAIFDYTLREGIPESYNALQIADSISFCLDLYEREPLAAYLKRAKDLADLGIENLWNESMFSRHTGEAIYESKLGSSSLGLALIRLDLAIAGDQQRLDSVDWSF